MTTRKPIRPPATLCFYSPDDPTPNDPAVVIEQSIETLNGVTYIPLAGQLAEARIVQFPSTVEAYGSGSGLFERIRDYVGRWWFTTVPAVRDLIAVYIMMTWMFDRFEAVPEL